MEKTDTDSDTFILIQSSIVAFAILLPLSMMRDMSAFRYFSLASIGALIYVGILLLIELPKYYAWYYKPA